MNIVKLLAGTAIALAVIQIVPYGRDHRNPPVTGEPEWDTPRTKELFNRACKDCHANQTIWPWYSNVAPVSWITQIDVNVGRRKFNVSEWDAAQKMRVTKLPLKSEKEKCLHFSTCLPTLKPS